MPILKYIINKILLPGQNFQILQYLTREKNCLKLFGRVNNFKSPAGFIEKTLTHCTTLLGDNIWKEFFLHLILLFDK